MEESQQHLLQCQTIRAEYWEEIKDYIENFGLRAENTEDFWLGGCISGKVTNKETAGIRAIAWRTLYAEVVKARIEDKRLRLKRAFFNFTRLMLSRVKAHGAKWRRWYMNQRMRRESRKKYFPAAQHGDNALIEIDEEATYRIHPDMQDMMIMAKCNQQEEENRATT